MSGEMVTIRFAEDRGSKNEDELNLEGTVYTFNRTIENQFTKITVQLPEFIYEDDNSKDTDYNYLTDILNITDTIERITMDIIYGATKELSALLDQFYELNFTSGFSYEHLSNHGYLHPITVREQDKEILLNLSASDFEHESLIYSMLKDSGNINIVSLDDSKNTLYIVNPCFKDLITDVSDFYNIWSIDKYNC